MVEEISGIIRRIHRESTSGKKKIGAVWVCWTTLKKATENSGKWSDIVQFGRKRELSYSMFYTLIEHAVSTNNSARYIPTLL